MPFIQERPIYKGLTPRELADGYDLSAQIKDFEEMRQTIGALHKAAAAKVPVVKDVAYGPAPLQKLDIYVPDGARNAPVLIDLHGGGWRSLTKNLRAIPAPPLLERGIVWAPIDYGLTPDHSLPEIVDHVRSAVAWIHANIADYGGDPARLYTHGHSAGSHLSAMCLLRGWHVEYGVPRDVLKGGFLASGVYDMLDILFASEGPNDVLQMSYEDAQAFSPINLIARDDPPIILGYGSLEPKATFAAQSINYANACRKAGRQIELIEVSGRHHGTTSYELYDPDSAWFAPLMKLIGAPK